MGEQLAAGQLGDGQRVSQVQLKEDVLTVAESPLGAVGDVVPDSGVGHVDGTKQVSGWMRGCTLYSPQERIQVTLLLKMRGEQEHQNPHVRPLSLKLMLTHFCGLLAQTLGSTSQRLRCHVKMMGGEL